MMALVLAVVVVVVHADLCWLDVFQAFFVIC
jgi:hypothetical protein